MFKRDYKKVGSILRSEGDPMNNYATTDTPVFACTDCGALVWSTEKHDRTHMTVALGLGF